MQSSSRHRAALWLRAEKAMGLTWAPAPVSVRPPGETSTPSAIPSAGQRKSPPPTIPHPKAPPPSHPAAPIIAAHLSAAQPLISGPMLPLEEKRSLLAAMEEMEVRGCLKCRLCETRTHTVFGDGDPSASIFFIGEGPGENEDLTGRPFVGRAGDLLTKMIVSMGLKRDQVYISNIVKCRPPGNRVPMPDEVEACTPYLVRQLEIIRPTVIVTLGLPAARYMLNEQKLAMGKIRGRWHSWRGIKLMPTYHPSYVLRTYTEQVRGMVWSDLKQVMAEVGLPSGA
jgi:DNA polymerase